MRKSLGVFVTLALVVAACGGPDDVSDVEGDEPVVQITSEGGFAPVELVLSTGPRYTLLGDGRLIYQGFQTMEFPGRLVPPYLVTTLDDNQMAAVQAMVEDIGLPVIDDEVDDSAAAVIADATTEVIRYWDDAGEHRLAVYALGIDEEASARNAAFLELITTFDRFTAETEAESYEPVWVRVFAGEGFTDPEFEDVREWPLEHGDFSNWTELPNGWFCTTVSAAALAPFENATQATTWEPPTGSQSTSPITLLVRPLLPGEPNCPS